MPRASQRHSMATRSSVASRAGSAGLQHHARPVQHAGACDVRLVGLHIERRTSTEVATQRTRRRLASKQAMHEHAGSAQASTSYKRCAQ